MDKAVALIGLLEFALIIGFMPIGIHLAKEAMFKRKDSKLFFKIQDDSFSYSARDYKDNKYILIIYLQAYITYGHNVRCNLTENEFRGNLLRFISQFIISYTSEIDDYLYLILSTINKSSHTALKCGGHHSLNRANIILNRVEHVCSKLETWNDPEIKDLVVEIRLIVNAVDNENNVVKEIVKA